MIKKPFIIIKKSFSIWAVFTLFYIALWQNSVQAGPENSSKADVAKTESDSSQFASVDKKLYVDQFEFQGATVFSDHELSSIVALYLKREVTSEELYDARDAITRHYVDNGYINSRAFLPNMKISDGKLDMQIIEGRLTGIKVSGNKRLCAEYIAPRLKRAIQFDSNAPLDINVIQTGLKLLKRDPRIENIVAKIEPQTVVSNAFLHIIIEEVPLYQMEVGFSNHKPPAVGSYFFNTKASLVNLTGWGDSLHGEWGWIEKKSDEYTVNYAVPVFKWGTTLSFGADQLVSTLATSPSPAQDIVSLTQTYSAALHHPFYKTLSQEFAIALQFDRRRNKTTDDSGEPYFINPNISDNISQASILRFSQEWVRRDLKQVFSARSSFNFGLSMPDTTSYDDAYPDGNFASWLGQFQWLKQIESQHLSDNLLLMRLNLQLSGNPLLPMEKFVIGGSSSVRGYKENLMTTDNGFVGSLEWRLRIAEFKIPWFHKKIKEGSLWFCPFFDIGHGWNIDAPDPQPDRIYSMGLGLLGSLNLTFQFKLYWGLGLRDVADFGEYDIQRDGIHFEVSADLF